jgi:hypothetical protein
MYEIVDCDTMNTLASFATLKEAVDAYVSGSEWGDVVLVVFDGEGICAGAMELERV